ncbi:MAG: hypothetical protein AB7P04_13665 [Bacteriovoracia bacterium]
MHFHRGIFFLFLTLAGAGACAPKTTESRSGTTLLNPWIPVTLRLELLGESDGRTPDYGEWTLQTCITRITGTVDDRSFDSDGEPDTQDAFLDFVPQQNKVSTKTTERTWVALGLRPGKYRDLKFEVSPSDQCPSLERLSARNRSATGIVVESARSHVIVAAGEFEVVAGNALDIPIFLKAETRFPRIKTASALDTALRAGISLDRMHIEDDRERIDP